MPNHVFNEVLVEGVNLEVIAPLVHSEGAEIDFNVLLPLPLNFWPGPVSLRYQQAFPGTQAEEAEKIWGSKSNAYGLLVPGRPPIEETSFGVRMRFKTSGYTPRGWTCALFNTLNLSMEVRWLDQCSNYAFREIYVRAEPDNLRTPKWSQERYESGTELHRQLRKPLWGINEP